MLRHDFFVFQKINRRSEKITSSFFTLHLSKTFIISFIKKLECLLHESTFDTKRSLFGDARATDKLFLEESINKVLKVHPHINLHTYLHKEL